VPPTCKEVESSDEEEEDMNKRAATSSTPVRRSCRKRVRLARFDDSDESERAGGDDSRSIAVSRNLKERILSPTEPQPRVLLHRVKIKEKGAADSAIDGDLLKTTDLESEPSEADSSDFETLRIVTRSKDSDQFETVLNHVVVLKLDVPNESVSSSGRRNKLVVCQWNSCTFGFWV
jgi:hypothetical protein